jgi:hypothetical protein
MPTAPSLSDAGECAKSVRGVTTRRRDLRHIPAAAGRGHSGMAPRSRFGGASLGREIARGAQHLVDRVDVQFLVGDHLVREGLAEDVVNRVLVGFAQRTDP